jgi:hypothetical protein
MADVWDSFRIVSSEGLFILVMLALSESYTDLR